MASSASFSRHTIVAAVIVFIAGSGSLIRQQHLSEVSSSLKSTQIDMPASSMATTTNINNNNVDQTLKWTPVSHSNKTATLCLPVKDPYRRYIDEFADYHILALGFTKIRLYDNTPEFALKNWAKETNKPYPVEAIHFLPGVTHPWPNASATGYSNVQDIVYRDCMKSEIDKGTDWVAAFDFDEYLVLKNGTNATNVLDFMDEYCPPPCGQISLNLLPFGTCNRTRYVPAPLSKRFTCSEVFGNPWVKAIVDPRAVKYDDSSLYWIHTFPLHRGRTWLDTTGKVIKARNKRWNMQTNPNAPFDVAVLYHFQEKSDEERWHKNCERRVSLNNATLFPCPNNKTVPHVPQGPIVHDDTVWQILRQAVPSYQRFDHVTDLG